MKIRLFAVLVFVVALSVAAVAQEAASLSSSAQAAALGSGDGQRNEQNQTGGRGNWSGAMGAGRGITGTVTEAAADHFTIKTDAGDIYLIHFSANTRILKQGAGTRGQAKGGQASGAQANGGSANGERGNGQAAGATAGGNPPQTLKASEIKVGDVIAATGEVDATAKSVGAVLIFQVDPERLKQMREMQANYGKTWLQGKVTAIDEVKVTILGSVDNAAHTFTADENTTFRKRRDPITLADIQSGDQIRVEGAIKDGNFVATTVTVIGAPTSSDSTTSKGGQPAAQPAH